MNQELIKPNKCPVCGSSDHLKLVTITHTRPHYQGWMCEDCIQEPDAAIWPYAFITSIPIDYGYHKSFPEILHDLRRGGFMVAVHNDYRLDGVQHTFWLMTKGEIALKGEGKTDLEALQQIDARARELEII